MPLLLHNWCNKKDQHEQKIQKRQNMKNFYTTAWKRLSKTDNKTKWQIMQNICISKYKKTKITVQRHKSYYQWMKIIFCQKSKVRVFGVTLSPFDPSAGNWVNILGNWVYIGYAPHWPSGDIFIESQCVRERVSGNRAAELWALVSQQLPAGRAHSYPSCMSLTNCGLRKVSGC